MDDDIIIGDIITNLNVTKRNVTDTLKLMQRLQDLSANSEVFNDLIKIQRELSDILDYFKANS